MIFAFLERQTTACLSHFEPKRGKGRNKKGNQIGRAFWSKRELSRQIAIGTRKGVITKGVLSLEESLESPKSLNSLESLENGQILHCFPLSGGSLESLESPEYGLF